MSFEMLLVVAAVAFLFAGTVKGLVGLGLPTTVIGILAQFTDPRQAIALLLLPILISNTWQIYRSGMAVKMFKKLWLFSLFMCSLIFITSQFAATISTKALTLSVGIMIVLFVVTNLFLKKLTISDNHDKAYQIGFGAAAGIMGGMTSLWAPPVVMYLLSKRVSKDEFVASVGVLLMAGSIPLLGGYISAGLTTPTLLLYSLLMVIPTLAGFAIGEWARSFLEAEQFRKILLGIFFLLGTNLIVNALI
ncbi:MAG: sulfite exporter TauE/SafE family protein [Hyphomicrobiales bacterium]